MEQIALRILLFIVGVYIVLSVLASATRVFVLPRSARDGVARVVFLVMRFLFNLRTGKSTTYEDRDRIMALYAPLSLLSLPAVWLALVLFGYMLMYWALGIEPLYSAFRASGSALLTLGFEQVDGVLTTILSFSEAAIGLILIALLIAYLPTMYSAFARREAAVAMLEVRAGSPPSAIELFERYHRLKRMDQIRDLWVAWEVWFNDLEESHTSLGALSFFRSPQPDRSWITAAGAILDAASLAASTIDIPRDPQTDLCIRAGYIALRRISDFFQIPYDTQPKPNDPISVSRAEFDAAYDHMKESGVPLKPDREQAWCDFAGWRVNYDTALLALASLTMAPYAPWSSDRSLRSQHPPHTLRQRLNPWHKHEPLES